MTVKYVVSIAGALLYFDVQRRPAEPLPHQAEGPDGKPDGTLIPPSQQPAAGSDWDDALGSYTREQRESAQITELA